MHPERPQVRHVRSSYPSSHTNPHLVRHLRSSLHLIPPSPSEPFLECTRPGPVALKFKAAEGTDHPARRPSSQARTASRRPQFAVCRTRFLSPFALDRLICSSFYSARYLRSEYWTSPREHISFPSVSLCVAYMYLTPSSCRGQKGTYVDVNPVTIAQAARAEPSRIHTDPPLPILLHRAFSDPWNVALVLSFILTFFFLNSRGDLLVFVSPSLPQTPARTPHRYTYIGVSSSQCSYCHLNDLCLLIDTAF